MIHLPTGAMSLAIEDFTRNGPIPFTWTRNHDAWVKRSGVLGASWFGNFDGQIRINHFENHWEWTKSNGAIYALEPLEYGQEAVIKSEKISYKKEDKGILIYDYDNDLSYEYQAHYEASDTFLLSKISRHIFSIEFDRDSNGRLSRIKLSDNRILKVEYNEEGLLAHVENEHSDVLVRYEYDNEEHLVAAYDALDQPESYDYASGHIIKQTYRNQTRKYWQYDNQAIEGKCLARWYERKLKYEAFEYEPGKTTVTNALGNRTVHIMEGEEIVQTIDALGHSEYWEYNLEGEVICHTDKLGHKTYYGYDDYGRQVSTTEPNGANTSYAYENHRLVLAKNAMGAITVWEYDEVGLLTSRIDHNNAITQYEYEDGLLSTIIDPKGNETELYYNVHYQLERALLPDGSEARWQYNAKGDLVSVTNPLKGFENYHYDALGRLRNIRTVEGNTIDLRYDGRGNIIEALDDQHHVHFDYSPTGSLLSRAEYNSKIRFKYDRADRLAGLANEHNSHYYFVRDANGNIVEEIGFDGLHRKYERNPGGQVAKVVTPDHKSTQYYYDKKGNLIKIDHFDSTQEAFSYNKLGQLTEAINEHAKVALKRDALGNILEETCNGVAVTNTYDRTGRRIKLESSLGAAIDYGRNQLGLVSQMMARHETTTEKESDQWEATIRHNALGLEIERNLPGGVTGSYTLDKTGKPLTHRIDSGETVQRNKTYKWGVNQQLLYISDQLQNDSISFEYHAFGNLSAAQYPGNEWVFKMPDEVGNLFKTPQQKDRKYGKAGQLLEDENHVYGYDTTGNLTEKTNKTNPGQVWKYTWNASGMLKAVTRPDGQQVTFTYDALGRRLTKTFKEKTTHFVWDGNVPLHEWQADADNPQLRVDEEGELSTNPQKDQAGFITWVFDEGTFRPAAKIVDDETYSIITDYLGTPVEMYDTDGQKTWAAELDIYGKIRKLERGFAEDCPFRYQGQYEDVDVETGLYYNRFRYFTSEQGIYISQDPIRLSGGISNFHNYVFDVNSSIDQLGLDLYALVASKDGWYPVMEWGKKKPIGDMFLRQGELWKIGESKRPSKRYSGKWLKQMGLDMVVLSNEKKKLSQLFERLKLKGYLAWRGFLPPGNKCCH